MKRTVFVAALWLVLSGALVFAAGGRETAQLPDGSEAQLVQLSGTVHQDIGQPLVLKTTDGSYHLALPMFMLGDLQVAQGEAVSVEGYLYPAGLSPYGSLPFLRVVKARIQDTEYVFAGAQGFGRQAGPMMQPMHGAATGRMGGRGQTPRGRPGWQD